MNNSLQEAKHYEKIRSQKEQEAFSAKILRDGFILNAFNYGYRQKEIANAVGLSESRVKHIICDMRRMIDE